MLRLAAIFVLFQLQAMFQTPVSAVSLVAEELHFISRAGDWACSAGRAGAPCCTAGGGAAVDSAAVPESPLCPAVVVSCLACRPGAPAGSG